MKGVRGTLPVLLLVVSLGLFGLMLFKHLAYPLIWHDEGETVMYGVHILEFGYPKVHGSQNVVYASPLPPEVGIHPRIDAYRGTTWGHFYLAALGVLLADGVEDVYARTARLRLPFAAAGAAGLGLLVLAILPALAERRQRLLFASAFFLVSAASVPLLLHLREARYPALLVLLSSGVLFVYLGATLRGREAGLARSLCLAVLLFLVFNTYFPAYVSLVIGLGLDRSLAVVASSEKWRARFALLLRASAPLLWSLVLVAPVIVFFDTFRVSREYVERAEVTAPFMSRLWAITSHLLRHQLVIPWIVSRIALGVLPVGGGADGELRLRAVSRPLLLVCVVHVLVVALNPMPFTRYVAFLGPLISAGFLVDVLRLWPRMRALPTGASWPLTAALATSVAVPLLWLAPLVQERWHEIFHPFRGPLDYGVAFILDHYETTEDLVIVTNTEPDSLAYYLGSKVIGTNRLLRTDQTPNLQPDVVIPRLGYAVEALDPYLEAGDYRREVLPVLNLVHNNVPEIEWLLPALEIFPTHRFRSAETAVARESAVLYWRPRER